MLCPVRQPGTNAGIVSSNVTLHLVSLGYMVTLFAVVGWSLVCWEAQLVAQAGAAPVAVASAK